VFSLVQVFMVDGSTRLDDALDRLYAAHDLPPDGGAHEPWFHVRVGPLTIPLPNPPARQRAVFVHDVNHVLTGYNAVFSDGEMSIAAFEVGAGCGRVWVAWFLNLALMALGIFVRPRGVFRAFVRGRHTGSLYITSPPRDILRNMTVDEVRRLIRLDEDVPEARPRHYIDFALLVGATWVVTLSAATAMIVVVSLAVKRLAF
jgi:hypothetical protein